MMKPKSGPPELTGDVKISRRTQLSVQLTMCAMVLFRAEYGQGSYPFEERLVADNPKSLSRVEREYMALARSAR